MSEQILLTKLFMPSPRADLVPRHCLIKRLNHSLISDCKLILISAPAGFGKTTLVCDWLGSIQIPIAWLTLDERDKDPARFLIYFIAALQKVKQRIGLSLQSILQSPQPLQIENILTLLINEISTIEEKFLIVLDDYHVIDSPQVDKLVEFLIEHQPPKLHLVITTREDPDLPLARLRARGHCIELRAADLRFSASETAEFLNRVMKLNLSGQDIQALEARTEGWIAGLLMAAISLQGLQDAERFIQSFTGSHRFVMDYLLEEVLRRQPATIQTFLQKTSILERMCAPLCDAILQNATVSSQSTLETLERANLFIIPQDNERRWYRYHHLFISLLRERLGHNLTPEEIARLHIFASQWYEDNDRVLEAFRHATQANDIERAMRLMESQKMPLHLRGTATTILDWLEKLPVNIRNDRPLLWWKQAALMLTIGQTAGVEENLRMAEAALDAAAVPGVEPDDATRDLIGRIAATRANLGQTRIQMETILVQARRALEYLHPNSLSHRSLATCALGYYYYWQNNWSEANRAYTEALSLARAAGDIPNSMLASIRLGQLQKDQNQIHLAIETLQSALQLLDGYSDPNAVVAYLGLTEIFYLQNNLDTAQRYAEQGMQLAHQYDQVIDRIIMSQLHLTIIDIARREFASAAQRVAQAEHISRQKNYTMRLPNIAYFRAWIYLQQGNLDAAAQLAKQYGLRLMQARVLIRQGEHAAALAILEPLRQEAEANGSAGRLLNVMTFQSVAQYALGNREKALDLLDKVLAQAEPEGVMRLFLDEGVLMLEMLSAAKAQGIRPQFVNQLLAAFKSEPDEGLQKGSVISVEKIAPSLLEPLSPRELEILRLLAKGLSNQQICQRLYLALDTVKGHNRKIFDKLNVKSRSEAIARAHELNLL